MMMDGRHLVLLGTQLGTAAAVGRDAWVGRGGLSRADFGFSTPRLACEGASPGTLSGRALLAQR